MQINGISNLTNLQNTNNKITKTSGNDNTFEHMLNSAASLLKDTNSLTNGAEQAEISYAMGLTNSTHDLQIAQEKAAIALQYTLTIRNAVLDSYNEIMNIQF